MLKKAWLLSLAIFCAACANVNKSVETRQLADDQDIKSRYAESSMQEQLKAGHWIAGPLDGQFIIIGLSGRMIKQEDEIETAKQDAARKAAMYKGLQGTIEINSTTGSRGFFDYSAESKLDLQYDQNFEQYLELLTFNPEKDLLRTDGAVYIRFKYNTSGPGINYYPKKINNKRPAWVNNKDLPQFDGYTTIVGYAGRRIRFRDTVFASCESAAAGLIETASYTVESSEKTGSNQGSTSTINIRSQGSLANFQVLEFWVNPDTQAVSTLAIARVSK